MPVMLPEPLPPPTIQLFNGFNRRSCEVGMALCDRVHLERSEVTEGLLGGFSSSPNSCCEMERSRWDRGGGQQRPQSLNTNVLLMPRCEGHQEHGLDEAFIVASVYNKARPPSSRTRARTVRVSTCTHTWSRVPRVINLPHYSPQHKCWNLHKPNGVFIGLFSTLGLTKGEKGRRCLKWLNNHPD